MSDKNDVTGETTQTNKFESMTCDEALEYLSQSSVKKDFVSGFDDIDYGIRAYDCLRAIIQEGVISPRQLPEYGLE